MTGLVFFIAIILPLVVFLLSKKYYSGKEIFLLNSQEQLQAEKIALEKSLKEKESLFFECEKELLATRQTNLSLRQNRERLEEENQALRNLLEALQKKRESKDEDIVVEYYVKP